MRGGWRKTMGHLLLFYKNVATDDCVNVLQMEYAPNIIKLTLSDYSFQSVIIFLKH